MAITEMLTWWYAKGWSVFIRKILNFMTNIVDFFSMDSLLRTLFQPFRQISAAAANADSSLDLKFHMFIDRLVSRAVGFVSRLFLLIVGLIIIIGGGLISLILIIIWPLVPFLPIIGIILSVMGVALWILTHTITASI